ncbi:ComEC/Rec2-like protein [Leadbettera azotonutricia ZAS-9]|uniref:ComEC/Rec2-like protein n=1 Tax=Leadbettera azotonutricia (strain ATCC BAA-888 / DSM 13862 / ZAS-9) TaxID=545695 RepID=F5YAC1_LEAAZ|nr:ComEC/Rec2-like protein [Leadbettera azotonutricia ZAS-9]
MYAALGAAVAFYSYPFFPGLPGWLLLLLLLPFIIAICLFRVLSLNKLSVFVSAAALGVSIGLAAGAMAPRAASLGLPSESINAVSGMLIEDPRQFNDDRGMGILALEASSAGDGLRASASGSITVFFPADVIPRLKEFGRGCGIYTEGKLIQSDRGLLFRASAVHIVKPASRLEQFRTGLRTGLLTKFSPKIDSENPASAPVWSSLAMALLLGVRDNLDSSLSKGFAYAGCSHVLSLSGMHLALLSGLVAFFLRRILGLKPAMIVGAVFILFYVWLAGGQASLVRSAIMYFLGAACVWGFLKRDALNLLCLAFIIQLLFQSGAGSSVSFILSYLSLAGILTLGETLHECFKGSIPEIIGAGLSASIGAFIATSAVVSLFFGELRPVGIIAGLIIVPLSSLFMIMALGILIIVNIIPLLFSPLNAVLTLVYRLIEYAVAYAGKVPGLAAPNPWPVLALSIIMAGLIYFVQYKASAYRSAIAPFKN